MTKFSVELKGSFFTFTLYDDRGREVFDVNVAASVAESLYGEDWVSVFNGEEALCRDDVYVSE